MSLIFSGLARGVIVCIRLIRPGWTFDPQAFIRDGKTYLSQHYDLLITTLALLVPALPSRRNSAEV